MVSPLAATAQTLRAEEPGKSSSRWGSGGIGRFGHGGGFDLGRRWDAGARPEQKNEAEAEAEAEAETGAETEVEGEVETETKAEKIMIERNRIRCSSVV